MMRMLPTHRCGIRHDGSFTQSSVVIDGADTTGTFQCTGIYINKRAGIGDEMGGASTS